MKPKNKHNNIQKDHVVATYKFIERPNGRTDLKCISEIQAKWEKRKIDRMNKKIEELLK